MSHLTFVDCRRMWRMQKSTWKLRHWSSNSPPTGIPRGMSSAELQRHIRWWWWQCWRGGDVIFWNVQQMIEILVLMFMTKGCKELQRVKEMFASCRWLLQRDSQHFPGKIMMMIAMMMMIIIMNMTITLILRWWQQRNPLVPPPPPPL